MVYVNVYVSVEELLLVQSKEEKGKRRGTLTFSYRCGNCIFVERCFYYYPVKKNDKCDCAMTKITSTIAV